MDPDSERREGLSVERGRIDLGSIDLSTLRIGSEAKATLSHFGIHTAQDLSRFRREELAELRHVTYVTLDVMEEGITRSLGKQFWIQGKRRSTKGRALTVEEMSELDVPIYRLDVDGATKAMLSSGSFHTCKQLACVSKDALLDCPGIDLEKAFELEAALGKLLKKRVFTGCYAGEVPWIVEGEEPFPWRLDHKEAQPDASAVSTGQDADPTPNISPTAATNDDGSQKRAVKKRGYARLADAILRLAHRNTEYSANFFYEALTPLRQELGLHDIQEFYNAAKTALSDRSDVTFTTGRIMRFGRCDRETQILKLLRELGRVTPEQLAQEYSTRYGVSEQTVSAWLARMKLYQKGTYLDVRHGSESKTRSRGTAPRSASTKQDAGIPELSSTARRKIKAAILDLVNWNTEYSTDYFFARQQTLLRSVGVDDAQMFYLLVKDLFSENGGVTFPIAGRIIRFGLCNRDRQIEDLLKTRYPIAVDDFVKSYSEAYGVEEESIYGWLSCIDKYRHDGVFDLDYTRTDTAAPPTGLATSVLEPLHTDGAARPREAEDTELELALRIVDSAQWNKEYSTDYFYNAFASQAHGLGARGTHEFYALVKTALSGYRGIGFPAGPRLIRFGLCNRPEQMVGLLKELSPVEVDEFVAEYTKRYGVPARTVREWLPYVSQYRRGNLLDMSVEAPTPSKSQKASNEQRLANAMLDLAQWGKEFSTDHFYENYPSLVQVAGAHDADEFYELVKGCLSWRRDITFPEGPRLIRFGMCSRMTQIISLLNELSPVSVEDFVREFEERYGIEEQTILTWTSCINRYRHDDVFDISYKPERVKGTALQPKPATS